MDGKWVAGREVLRSRNWGKSLTGMNVVENDVVFMEVLVMLALSGVQKVAAADSPAPSPTSDAYAFFPTFFASLAALAFGFFF